jgi:hypothetical protein
MPKEDLDLGVVLDAKGGFGCFLSIALSISLYRSLVITPFISMDSLLLLVVSMSPIIYVSLACELECATTIKVYSHTHWIV